MDDPRSITDEEILAQLAAAREAELAADRTEPRARTAWYDERRGRIVVELKSGAAFAIPVGHLDELDGADAATLAEVEPISGGEGLAWEALDVHISVPGILASMLGPELVRAFARRGGSATSERKAAAARENGRKGGRPRTRPRDGTLMAAEPPFRWGEAREGEER
jgi:hypothetical protein